MIITILGRKHNMCNKKFNISVTGASGNMGQGFLDELNKTPNLVDGIKILCLYKNEPKKLKKKYKNLSKKFEFIVGNIASSEICDEIVKDCSLVLNMCAVIPPKSDQRPQSAIDCNEIGVRNLVNSIEKVKADQPALVHISTVALYGHRTGANKFGRVGDPLVPSPFDIYSATKLRGEYMVLESDIKTWVVLRQTAILHYNMFKDNLSDGLMFHTNIDSPLEWVTSSDSGLLMRNIVAQFKEKQIPDHFFKKVYNIGGGASTRTYGYETYDEGFKIINGSFKDFFKPHYNATRNFHGMWYLDSDALEKMFHFRRQSCSYYWKEMSSRNKIYKLGKLIPKSWIAHFTIKRLLKNYNSPAYWAKTKQDAKLIAAFGSVDKYNELKNLSWIDVKFPDEKNIPIEKTTEERILAYGYDINKTDKEITKEDLIQVANAHGGQCVNADIFDGNLYKKLLWKNSDGEEFSSTVYSVIRAGHWYNSLYNSNVWEFDRLAKKDKIFAHIWYDSHGKDENNKYIIDKNFNSRIGE